MEDSKTTDRLSLFQDSGIYRFENSNAVFIDSVRLLNRSYSRFRVSPSVYYSRFFGAKRAAAPADEPVLSSPLLKKRKRKEKLPKLLNERERAAYRRHQEVSPMLLNALQCLAAATDLLAVLRDLRSGFCSSESRELNLPGNEPSFIELGSVWQAPLYEIALDFPPHHMQTNDAGSLIDQCSGQKVLALFNNLVVNDTCDDVEAEFLNSIYIIPGQSCFCMSDLGQIHNLIPAEPYCGFNLILIDPPWENASASQKGTNSQQLASLRSVLHDEIVISIPGDYSRKPPIGELLLEHVPGPKPSRCIELFAREMIKGWTSWGNEPLHFQKSSYFLQK